MQVELTNSFYAWVHALPASRMKPPQTFWQKAKYAFWRLYTPYHPVLRDTATSIGVIRHVGRQHYLLGKIAPGETLQSIISYLIDRGFGNHFIAWKDEGEVIGLRYAEDFVHQYHIRIFNDGEVRGHFEYTPECRPIHHIREVGQEPRREFFLNLLRGRIVEMDAEEE